MTTHERLAGYALVSLVRFFPVWLVAAAVLLAWGGHAEAAEGVGILGVIGGLLWAPMWGD